jgi:hypothetical protein
MAKPKIVILSKAPAQPTAGQSFTATFQLLKAGAPMHISPIKCFAYISGRPVKVLAETSDGTTGRCSWAIPAGSRGAPFGGIIAMQLADASWFYGGFDLTVR